MDCDFSVGFKWDMNSENECLYVRATTVFSELSQAQKRVERCIQHSHESFNNCESLKKIFFKFCIDKQMGVGGFYWGPVY